MKYIKQRGTEDIFGKYVKILSKIESVFLNVATLSGYSEIRTPMFEAVEVFSRSVGESSDIVKKEFYNFKDKGDREIALRPEGTASVIRAVIENKLLDKEPLPLKYCYSGPMFRYERPQSGRLRQFNQFGCEIIGAVPVYDDVDCLSLAVQLLESIQIKNWTLEINNIGNFESREKWISALKKYLEPFKSQLSELSQERLESNPLRILDDKIDGKLDFVLNAPKVSEFLSSEEKEAQSAIEKCLKDMGIKFKVNPNLVRGLDYYTNLVFEFIVDDSTVLAGGRYAKLVSEFGGENYSCIGFGAGLQRLCLLIEKQNTQLVDEDVCDVVIGALTDDAKILSLSLLNDLRKNGVSAVCKFSLDKLVKVFSYAERIKAKNVVIIGAKELENKTVMVKNQTTLEQKEIKIADLIDFIKNK